VDIKKSDEELLAKNNIFVTTLEKLWNWGRSRSFWPVSYGCNCCPIEMMASGAARFDIARYGYEVFRAASRQADVLVVAGPITAKMRPAVERIYSQMAEPKWVIAMGNCATSGGPFADGYSVLPGADTIFHVDVYIPGCPVRPEALFQGLLQLKKMVENKQQEGTTSKRR
jgi:NADH-quinone oxidoreductase subunit B